MYIPDLQKSADGKFVNIGWLSKEHEYPRGEVSSTFLNKLEKICDNPVMLHRGFHVCEFCKADRNDTAKWAKIGNGHIKVNYRNKYSFWAPTMIHHYISVHNYMPPQEFIDAVMELDETAMIWRSSRVLLF
jgi:hypothetical protein